MNSEIFLNHLASVKFSNVFNPYTDICPVYDKFNAATIRRINLQNYLDSALALSVDTLWMGRDLGYLGGRRTGIALTDEHHLPRASHVYKGFTPLRATHGSIVKERTASEVWGLLDKLASPPLLWNVFQFHPHDRLSPFTNRKFSIAERNMADEINSELINWLKIKRIIAIGKDAATYAKKFGIRLIAVRHPSYGGIVEFRQGISQEYGINFSDALLNNQPMLFNEL